MALNELGLTQNPLKLQKLWDEQKKSNIFNTGTVYNDITQHTVNIANKQLIIISSNNR